MKLCPKCDHSPLPFLMVFVIATVSAFVTWLTLGLSQVPPLPRAAAGALAFVVVGGALLHYVLSCLKRHCRHQDRPAPARTVVALPERPGAGRAVPRREGLGVAA